MVDKPVDAEGARADLRFGNEYFDRWFKQKSSEQKDETFSLVLKYIEEARKKDPGVPAPSGRSRCSAPSWAYRGGSRRYRAPGWVPVRPAARRRARRRRGARSATTRRARSRPRSPSGPRPRSRRRSGCAIVGGPRSRRDLRDDLGERSPRAVVLPASPPCLVPPHDDSILPVGDVARGRRHPGLHRGRDHSARRARRRRLVRGHRVHHTDAVRQAFDTLNPNSWQPEQQCRTVEHGPWFPSSVRKRCNSQTSEGQGPPHATTRPMRAKSQLPL